MFVFVFFIRGGQFVGCFVFLCYALFPKLTIGKVKSLRVLNLGVHFSKLVQLVAGVCQGAFYCSCQWCHL